MLRHQDLYYVYDMDKLLLGGTYSNENLLVRLLADSSIGGMWSARDDQQYCGKWKTDFYVGGRRDQAGPDRVRAGVPAHPLRRRWSDHQQNGVRPRLR